MSVIDGYLARFDGPDKAELEKIRSIVHKTVPDVQEVMTYGMPGFKYKDKYLAAFCVFKDHLGFFPTSAPIEAHKDELTGFKTSKGGIQFTPQKPMPESLIKEILLTRVAEISKALQ